MLKVGLIGFGSIGKDVAHYIKERKVNDVSLKGILVRNKEKVQQLEEDWIVCDHIDEFLQLDLDVVIEAAGHDAVYQFGEDVLLSGKDLMIISVGALADETLHTSLEKAAERTNTKLMIPSAAIAGLDRIASARFRNISEIKLITRKPPRVWYGTIAEERVNLETICEPYCIFSGTARQSAKLFPESVNVSAALSLAGIGFDETEVEVYVDPTVQHNTHEIAARGDFGEVRFQVQNTPSADNPKSGYIVAMSICKVLNNLTSRFVIGI
ncbi:aspartate dehydrogenase [Bacillus taeanensis]|uniref:L-aspartate dehydrogenase n=1 Tax=Bacillus taeanensis TaxID=273032 RepID=A0A366XXW6_9BACI|nr:aspartate dehydrogenase [Bacillus taeanensis]RBW70982.1 aspartate dehydrogenase [Bacillus taeanensis]